MSLIILKANALPSDTKTHENWEDIGWDIDRWENDGGRSISTSTSVTS